MSFEMRIPCYFLLDGFPVIQAQFVKITHLLSSQSHSSDTNLWCPPAAIMDLNQQSKRTGFNPVYYQPCPDQNKQTNKQKHNCLHNTATAQASSTSFQGLRVAQGRKGQNGCGSPKRWRTLTFSSRTSYDNPLLHPCGVPPCSTPSCKTDTHLSTVKLLPWFPKIYDALFPQVIDVYMPIHSSPHHQPGTNEESTVAVFIKETGRKSNLRSSFQIWVSGRGLFLIPHQLHPFLFS